MRLVRRLTSTAFAMILGLAGAAGATDGPPNLVLILADDLGWGDVGFNGRQEWATPNLDKLVARGAMFPRFYTAAVVCAPSRGALLTGKSTIHCGVSKNNDDLPAEETTIAEALKARGYATALFGKWHHGAPRDGGKDGYVHPMDQGFDRTFGFLNATHAHEKFPTELWDGREKVASQGYADDLFTDKAVAYLEEMKDRPFFLYLPLISAHFRIEAPEEEVALHRGKFRESDPAKPLNATYAAMVTRFDREVGRVMERLEALGLAEKTLVVVASDHGATFEKGNLGTSNFHDSNRPLRGQKRTLWEGGVRVPAVACWPGVIPAGRTIAEPMQTIDLLPTFLAAAGGMPNPACKVDGRDLLSLWKGGDGPGERTLFWEWRAEGTEQSAAMRGRYKYVLTGGNRAELFDVEADPAERRNILADHNEIGQGLGRELTAWLASETRRDRK